MAVTGSPPSHAAHRPGLVDAVPVRDSKAPEGPALVFPTPSWSSFVSAVRGGEFHGT
ncbi:DUF397 domain-containing protein [Streptomyces rugosispiralis]|uniref:DUF397 domain-containing protein n=1 Tax=Streptomyces rugosispiralis TaxID=2967341 RepID=A0ABT1V9L8_9ACTN|nr:DUF397 domain-containing protein [Streptomyces rugosispiralis]MCQ8193986.1 DUF397 domain-containing protein [Streptomyces rugosispiralis]